MKKKQVLLLLLAASLATATTATTVTTAFASEPYATMETEAVGNQDEYFVDENATVEEPVTQIEENNDLMSSFDTEAAVPETEAPAMDVQAFSETLTDEVLPPAPEDQFIPFESIIIEEGYTTMEQGEVKQFHAITAPANATERLCWMSSDPENLYVDENGLVTAKKDGYYTLTAYGNTAQVMDQITIDVFTTLESVQISKDEFTLYEGESEGIHYITTPADIDLSGSGYRVVSDNKGVAEVYYDDSFGGFCVKGVAEGEATITLKVPAGDGFFTDTAKVVVKKRPEADKAALTTAIAKAEKEAALTDKYTEDSIAKLNAVIAEAKALLDNADATQPDVDAMVVRVNDAVKALEEKPVVKPEADKAALTTAIAKAEKEATLTDKYTEDSIAKLNAVIAEAKALLDNADATQPDVDAMVVRVNDAVKALEEKPVVKPEADKAALTTAIAKAEKEAALTDKYTEDSIAKLNAVIAEAKALLDNADATQPDVDAMVVRVNDAVKALEEKPVVKPEADKAALTTAIAKAEKEAALTDKYTEDSIAKLNAVIAEAKALLDNADATQPDVDAMVVRVNDAVKALKEKPVVKPEADKAALTTAIAKAEKEAALTDKYTEDSIAKLNAVIAEAKALLDNADATQPDVDAMVVRVNDAVKALEEKPVVKPEADKAALTTAIAKAEKEAALTDKYTEDSIAKLNAVIAEAKALLDNADATQPDVDAMVVRVNDAVKALKEKPVVKPEADKAALTTAIAKAEKEAALTDKYTEDSIAKLNAVIAEAKALLDNADATQPDVDAMVVRVNDAVKALKEKPVVKPEADKAALTTAIAKAEKEAALTDKYTEDSIAKLNAVIAEAKALLDNADATQPDVDAMVVRVNDAVKALKEKPVVKPEADKAALTTAIAKAEKEAALTDKYTEDSIAKLNAVIAEAKALLDNADATQPDVDAMVVRVNDAVKALKEKPVVKPEADKAALTTAIAKAEKEAALTDKYTEDSIAKLNAVIAEAKALLDNADATQPDVDAMVVRVNDAVKALEEKPVEPETPETEKPEIPETPETEKPEIPETPETEKPETEKPETEKPETEKPETEKPETEKPETEKPETAKPETNVPKTGDPAMVGLLGAATAFSAGLIAKFSRKCRKKDDENK